MSHCCYLHATALVGAEYQQGLCTTGALAPVSHQTINCHPRLLPCALQSTGRAGLPAAAASWRRCERRGPSGTQRGGARAGGAALAAQAGSMPGAYAGSSHAGGTAAGGAGGDAATDSQDGEHTAAVRHEAAGGPTSWDTLAVISASHNAKKASASLTWAFCARPSGFGNHDALFEPRLLLTLVAVDPWLSMG